MCIRDRSKAVRGSSPAGRVSSSLDMTWASWVYMSTPWQSASVTTPTGRFSQSTTMIALWARLGSSCRASPTVSCGVRMSGVSWTRSRFLTQSTTFATTSRGMS